MVNRQAELLCLIDKRDKLYLEITNSPYEIAFSNNSKQVEADIITEKIWEILNQRNRNDKRG